jgi:hypothetical protein
MPRGVYDHWKIRGRPKTFSEQHKKNLSLSRLGIKFTEKQLINMSLSHLGNVSPMKGKKYPEEVKNRMRESKLNFYKKHPESIQRERLSLLSKNASKETIRKRLIRREKSTLEAKAENIINNFIIPYIFVGDGKFFIERLNPDFINTNGEKIAIEVFYRRHKEDFKDGGLEEWKRQRQEVFSKYGWRIEFFDETQVNKEEFRRRFL